MVVAARFSAVAARLPRGPPAAPVLAVVDKEPEASIVCAMPDAFAIRSHEQIGGRPDHRGENRGGRYRVYRDTPGVALALGGNALTWWPLRKCKVQQVHVAFRWHRIGSEGEKDSREHLAELNRVAKEHARAFGMTQRPSSQLGERVLWQHSARFAPG